MSWKESKVGKRGRGWLGRRSEGCGGDEKVRGQRSAPLVISPVPERQSRPGQWRFRCQRETTDWRDLSCAPSRLDLSSFLLSVYPQNPQLCHPLILPSILSPHSPSFSPLKLNITTGFHSAGQADWGSSLRGCMSSVHHHMLTRLTLTLTQEHAHTAHCICTQVVGRSTCGLH